MIYHKPHEVINLKHQSKSQLFGQIIATSHDLGPQNLAEEGKAPDFSEIYVKYYDLARII